MADEEVLTAEQIAGHFSAMDDSVVLINEILADDTEAKELWGVKGVKEMVKRNTDHLEIQAEKSWYSDSSKSKTPYTTATTTGKAYIGQ